MDAPPLERCRICSGKVRRKIFGATELKDAGISLFSRQYGDRDILHDPQFSDRERREHVARAREEETRRSLSAAFPGARVITPHNQPKGVEKRKREI
jgi:hypothetical protein